MPKTLTSAFSATKILLPIDFSPSSDTALEAATGLARQFHAGIHLVHIIAEIPDFNGSDFFPETAVLQERRDTIEQKLGAFKTRLLLEGVQASFSIDTGNDIVGNLMRVIEIQKADMVVISTHGLSGWRPFILGSIAEQVIKQVNCPLLLLQSPRHVSAVCEPAMEVWEDTFVPRGRNMKSLGLIVPSQDSSVRLRLDHSAEELAKRPGLTQQHYDQDHSLFFTK